MKKRHYGMLSLAFTSCLAVHAENKNQNTDKPNVNPEKPDVPLNKNDAFQKVQKRRVQEKR